MFTGLPAHAMDQSHEAYHYAIRAGAGDDAGGTIVLAHN
jgi:hypothetical protein